MALAASQRYMSDGGAAHPDRETVLLYDQAIAALGDAITAIAKDDIEGRCAAVCAATEAVTMLYLNLDVRRFGELADDLASVYGHILDALVGINLYNDPGIARDAIELIESLRDPETTTGGMISAYKTATKSGRKAKDHGTETRVPRAR